MACNTIYIRNLGEDASESTLKSELRSLTDGFVGLKLTRHRQNNKTMCFAEFESDAASAVAMTVVEGHKFSFMSAGYKCAVSYATNPLNVKRTTTNNNSQKQSSGGGNQKELEHKQEDKHQPKSKKNYKNGNGLAHKEVMTIPAALAGRVIGFKGAQLRQISMKTGASVRVSPDMREGRRIVQMSGDEQQKASAIEMINQIVEATGEAGAEGAGNKNGAQQGGMFDKTELILSTNNSAEPSPTTDQHGASWATQASARNAANQPA